MKMYEIASILKYYDYHFKIEWETARFISYVQAQINNKKRLKPIDICRFEWDKEGTYRKDEKKLTEEDIQLFREKAKKIIETNFIVKNGK